MRAADRLGARLGEAEEAHLPLAHQVGHGADDVLDRDGRVHPVLVEQVNPIGAEPSERALHRLSDVRWPAVQGAAALPADVPPELGR